MNYQYSSMLRIGEHVLYSKEQQEDLWNRLETYPGCFEELVFFTQFTHSVRTPEELEHISELMNPLLEKTRSLGLQAGIDVLCTIGHMNERLAPEMAGYAHYVDQNGHEITGKLCPSDEKNHKYIKQEYQLFAAMNPSVLYIDDDISYMSCYCPLCIQRFQSKTHLLPEDDVNIAGLNKALQNEQREIRQNARKFWISFNASRINELFVIIEKAVHEINPSTEIGFMTCSNGSDGLETEQWANTLRGNLPSIRWRPGGGLYTEFTPNEALEKANRIGAQIRYLPGFARIVESEIENFPYQSLKKSPTFTAFEVMTYLAAGCTGTAYNVCSTLAPDYAEHDKFFKLAKNVQPFATLLTSAFGRSAPDGIGCFWKKDSGTEPQNQRWHEGTGIPTYDEPYQIGLPIAYDSEHMSVYFLDENIAKELTNTEMLLHLKKGVLMDAGALAECNRRGYEKYTGFRIAGAFPADALERDLEHPLNLRCGNIRDVRQAFGWYGTAHTIEKVNDQAEYISELINYQHSVYGAASGIFENELGGRVAVGGFAPFIWCFSLARSVQLKNLCRWLSKDHLRAYLHSFHRMELWVRANAVFIGNLAMEQAKNVELAILHSSETVILTVYSSENTVTAGEVALSRKEGKYSVFQLPEIPIMGCAIIQQKQSSNVVGV